MNFPELRFQSEKTIDEVKMTLYPKTGTEPEDMQLSFVSPSSGDKVVLEDGSRTLEAYDVVNGTDILLVDTSVDSVANNLNVGAQKVEKYEAKSGDAGFAAYRKARSAPPPATDDTDKEAASAFEIGYRIKSKKSGATGTVQFIGQIEQLPKGYWLGIELDEATGKHDGEIKGVRVFTCEAKKGAVMRPSSVLVL
eukprot:Stramenopile-MAST_4_protein_3715